MLRASFKDNPAYRNWDLSWISPLVKKLPLETRAQIDRRKEKKYIPYVVADAIPGKIRFDRDRNKNLSEFAKAVSLRDELLMRWLIILPWRQKNLRECRISGGAHQNLFLGPVRPRSAATRPKWLELQEKSNPGQPVWHVSFSKEETKAKNEVTGFLPADLVPLLEEYLAHRHALIPIDTADPGTLFVNNIGNAMHEGNLCGLVRTLTAKHAGVAVNPHLFRDIVAYEWLSTHPEDYLTLSKLLWHTNLEYTLKVYGSRFDESTGIARMDDWRSSRS